MSYTPEQKQMIEQYASNAHRRSMDAYRRHRSMLADAAGLLATLFLLLWWLS